MEAAYRVLLADGDESFCNTMAGALRNANYQCDCVNEAGKAKAMIAAASYDTVILDAEMAGNSRLELVRAASETASGLPVILVAAHPTVESAVSAVHLPVEAYLVKPFDFEKMRPFLCRATARCRIYRSVTDAKQRVGRWNDAANKLQELLQEPFEGSAAALVGPLIIATFDNIVKSIIELRRIVTILASVDCDGQRTELLGLLGKIDLARAALHETVDVLEESKHAFKSKRLGDLRHQLQALLTILEKE
jgi:ActR/RegA family two-component response regulator